MAIWDDTRLAPHVRAAAKEIGERFRITNIGGFATSGHIANSNHYKGLALDFMTINGQALADYVVGDAARLGATEVIWNRRIWTPGKGWQPYSGSSPHTDHVHVSFRPDAVDPLTGQPLNAGKLGCMGLLIGMVR